MHENTLESQIVFLPAVWIFSLSVNYHFGVSLGLPFVIARIIYAAGYLSAASKRATGAIVLRGCPSDAKRWTTGRRPR